MTETFVDESAVVDDGAKIGAGTRVWHFSHICSGASIGEECTFGQNVFVAGGARIGKNVKVQNNVSIYDGVCLEDDVFCGPSTVFTNVINPRSHVSRKHEYKSTLVGRGATIGANSTIICGVTIGEYSFIAAGAVVTKDVKAYALVQGVPSVQTGWVSSGGIKLELPVHSESRRAVAHDQIVYELEGGILTASSEEKKVES